jgi:ribosome biogenesis GTPase
MVLDSYGWNSRVAALAAEFPDAPVGRVVRVDLDRCHVVCASGIVEARAHPLPAVGDWVVLDDEGESVVAGLPRWSALTRGRGEQAEAQVLAANVDIVAIAVPLDRPISLNRIERELVIAWDAPAAAVVVLTKADMHPDPDAAAVEVADRCAGVDIVVTSAVDGIGMVRLAEIPKPDRTVVLFGASGAGKSTLANQMLGADVLETGAVRVGDNRGRHTTSARHLLPLPGGGVLLDTPGLRGLQLWGDGGGVEAVFADVEAFAAQCRFRDCAHEAEPGCAVNGAVRTGELDPERLSSYRKLLRELAHLDRQQDPLARAAQTQQWKQIHKAIRKNPKR